MSVIGGIGTAAPQMSPSTVAVTVTAGVTAQAQTTSGTAAPPAVVVSLSGAATASAAKARPALPTMDPTAVETALARLADANGLTFIATHTDYAHIEAQFGAAIANRDEELVQGAAAGGASIASSAASFLVAWFTTRSARWSPASRHPARRPSALRHPAAAPPRDISPSRTSASPVVGRSIRSQLAPMAWSPVPRTGNTGWRCT